MSKQVAPSHIIPWNTLEQMYQKRASAIQSATQSRDRLRQELNQAEALLKDLHQGTVVTGVPIVSQKAARQATKKSQAPVPDLIEQVLVKNGNAMTVKDITDTIVAMGGHSAGRTFQKAVNSRLQNLKRFRRIAPGLYDLYSRDGSTPQPTSAKPLLNPEPLNVVAAKVLQEHGEPMAIPALAQAVLAKGYKTASTFDVFSQSLVSRMVKDKGTFIRVGPGVYALASWSPAQ